MASRLFPSDSEALESIINRMVAQASFCLPGIIEEFNPGPPQIAKVVPAIMRKVTDGETVQYMEMPVILNVPVVVPFAQAAGLLLTVPIKKGDEGLIVFADRMIDNFVEKGKFRPPECCGSDNKTTEPRAHSLTDAIFIPGIISKPQAVENWNPDAMELRTRDGKNYVRVGSGGYGVRFSTDGGFEAGGADIRMQGGKIWLYGQEINTRAREQWTEQPPIATGGTRSPTMPD